METPPCLCIFGAATCAKKVFHHLQQFPKVDIAGIIVSLMSPGRFIRCVDLSKPQFAKGVTQAFIVFLLKHGGKLNSQYDLRKEHYGYAQNMAGGDKT